MNNKPSIFERLRMSNRIAPEPLETPVDTLPIVKNESAWECFDVTTADELLTRDWFIDEQYIYDIIDCADQEAWDYIYLNRRKYSRRIREIIEPNDYRIPLEKLRIKVRCVSDQEWNDIIRQNKSKLDVAFEKDWTEYSECVSDRPLKDVDSRLDDAWDRFGRAKDKLTKYLESRPKSYIPPSMRGKEIVDPKQTVIENEIRSMENEYDKIQKLVAQADSEYWKTKKNEYRKNWMPKLSS